MMVNAKSTASTIATILNAFFICLNLSKSCYITPLTLTQRYIA